MPNRQVSGRIASVDGIRGLAILVVLLHNTSFILREAPGFALKLVSAVTATGWLGVQVFFVLSGFLITGLLLNAAGGRGYFRTFYVRRTLRIFPLYYAVLAVAFLVVPVVTGPTSWAAQATRNQWWYWAYASNWGDPHGHGVAGLSHFWSLAVEEQFYLAWPLVVAVLSRRWLLRACIALVVAGPVVRLLLLRSGAPELAVSEITIARMDALAGGATLATLAWSADGRAWLQRWYAMLGAAGMALVLAVLVAQRGFHEGDPVVQVAGQSGVILAAAMLLYACAASPDPHAKRVSAAFAARWLRALGKYSYAIYVFHWPIHVLLSSHVSEMVNHGGQGQRLLRLALYQGTVAALSAGAAVLSWRLLELPMLRLKERIAPHRPGTIVPTTGTSRFGAPSGSHEVDASTAVLKTKPPSTR